MWSVVCFPPATSASVARLMLSTSRNVNARTVRWPLLSAAGYKLVLLSRKVLCPVLSIRTVCVSIQGVPVQELSHHTLETKPQGLKSGMKELDCGLVVLFSFS